MRPRFAEIALFLVLMAILASAALVFLHHRSLPAGLAAAGHDNRALVAVTLVLLLSAFLAGLFCVLPLVHRQSREHGKLHSLARTLAARSNDMERAAHTDMLTGLSNRRYFDAALKQYLQEFRKIDRPVGLLIVDIDHFKSVNDNHGHDIGDAVLRTVSQCLLDTTRGHDVVARMGGEEFAVVAPDTGGRDLEVLAERLRAAVERLVLHVGNVRLRITTSVGLATSRGEEAPAELYKRADVNLYRAKANGRNRICA